MDGISMTAAEPTGEPAGSPPLAAWHRSTAGTSRFLSFRSVGAKRVSAATSRLPRCGRRRTGDTPPLLASSRRGRKPVWTENGRTLGTVLQQFVGQQVAAQGG